MKVVWIWLFCPTIFSAWNLNWNAGQYCLNLSVWLANQDQPYYCELKKDIEIVILGRLVHNRKLYVQSNSENVYKLEKKQFLRRYSNQVTYERKRTAPPFKN